MSTSRSARTALSSLAVHGVSSSRTCSRGGCVLEVLEVPALGVRSGADVAVALALLLATLRDAGGLEVFVAVLAALLVAGLAEPRAAVLFVVVALVGAGFFAGTGLATMAFLAGEVFLAGVAFLAGEAFFAGEAFVVGVGFLLGVGFLFGDAFLVVAAANATVASAWPFPAGAVLPASAALIADIAFFTAMLGPFEVVALVVPTNADGWREDKAILQRTQWRNAAVEPVSPCEDSWWRIPAVQVAAQRGADRDADTLLRRPVVVGQPSQQPA